MVQQNQFLTVPKLQPHNFPTLCGADKTCVTFFSSRGAADFKEKIKIMREISEKKEQDTLLSMATFVWVDVQEQSAYSDFFFPFISSTLNSSLAVVYPNRKVFYAFDQEKWTQESITVWIKNTLKGRTKLQSIKGDIPPLVQWYTFEEQLRDFLSFVSQQFFKVYQFVSSLTIESLLFSLLILYPIVTICLGSIIPGGQKNRVQLQPQDNRNTGT